MQAEAADEALVGRYHVQHREGLLALVLSTSGGVCTAPVKPVLKLTGCFVTVGKTT